MKEIVRFTKLHGCGNDYLYINCMDRMVSDPCALSRAMSPRHFSVGSDGVILICPSDVADARMRMFNADGSEGRMCGNGIRCFGKYLYDYGIVKKTEIDVETLAGIKHLRLNVGSDDKVKTLFVDMGKASLVPEDIPVRWNGPMIGEEVTVRGEKLCMTAVSMGSPHAVTFVDDVDSLDLEKIGPDFENFELFPDRVNTEFVQVIDDHTLKMRVWERGSGETWACGTGSCASVVAAVLAGICKRDEEVTVKLRGGDLKITWCADDTVFMEGPAERVYDGIYEFEAE